MGVTVRRLGVASVTMTSDVPLMPPALAVSVTWPLANPVTLPCVGTPVAKPGIPGSSLIAAIAESDDDHRTEPVRFSRLPSVNVPIATRPKGTSLAKLTGGGGGIGSSGGQLFRGSATDAAQMSILNKDRPFTTKEPDPVWPAREATTLVWPGPAAAAKPIGLTLATASSVALQAAVSDRSCCEPSLKLPVATNCCPPPSVTPAVPGATLIPLSVAALAFKTADAFPTFP